MNNPWPTVPPPRNTSTIGQTIGIVVALIIVMFILAIAASGVVWLWKAVL
jgi:hypothetical protein